MTTHETATRYPLTWPTGWARTPASWRKRARFSSSTIRTHTRADGTSTYHRRSRELTIAEALDRLAIELRRLGARFELVSTNVELRNDGIPRSNRRDPDDPGAAVYFLLNGKPRCLACDRWDRVADNIGSIAGHIDAIRAIDRYGVGTLDQAFAGYTAALPPDPGHDWRLVLGFGAAEAVSVAAVQARFRAQLPRVHPDNAGGSHDAMVRLNNARDAAFRELGA